MENTKTSSDTQDNIHIESKINHFFNRFQIGTLLHRCGIGKRHGHSVCSLTEAIFNSLTNDNRESVLIIDDSTYDRSRSKWVELLSRVYDHANRRAEAYA